MIFKTSNRDTSVLRVCFVLPALRYNVEVSSGTSTPVVAATDTWLTWCRAYCNAAPRVRKQPAPAHGQQFSPSIAPSLSFSILTAAFHDVFLGFFFRRAGTLCVRRRTGERLYSALSASALVPACEACAWHCIIGESRRRRSGGRRRVRTPGEPFWRRA